MKRGLKLNKCRLPKDKILVHCNIYIQSFKQGKKGLKKLKRGIFEATMEEYMSQLWPEVMRMTMNSHGKDPNKVEDANGYRIPKTTITIK